VIINRILLTSVREENPVFYLEPEEKKKGKREINKKKKRRKEMKKTHLIASLVMFTALLTSTLALAASTTADLTIRATMNAQAKLTLNINTITFSDADPDSTTSILANEGAINVSAKVRTGASSDATLTLLAAGDLTSGSDSIAIGNVIWGAGGTGFTAGTMSKSSPVTVGSWRGSGSRSGTMTFSLANSWSYATGSYSATSTFTLTAP
jgi:hypothetical protein